MGMWRVVTGAAAAVLLAACSGSGGGGGGSPAASESGSLQSYFHLSRSYFDQYGRLDTPDGVRQVYEAAARDIHAALAVAPAEIRGDVKIVADGVDQLV